ncbi:MAG: hypothetical protein QXP45_02130 [Thermoproteota archaeon]
MESIRWRPFIFLVCGILPLLGIPLLISALSKRKISLLQNVKSYFSSKKRIRNLVLSSILYAMFSAFSYYLSTLNRDLIAIIIIPVISTILAFLQNLLRIPVKEEKVIVKSETSEKNGLK